MFYKADFYDVSGSGRNWKATVFQGVNVIDEIEAVSEKQAHFLAKQEYPEAATPIDMEKAWNEQYYSAEGRAYRAKKAWEKQQKQLTKDEHDPR